MSKRKSPKAERKVLEDRMRRTADRVTQQDIARALAKLDEQMQTDSRSLLPEVGL